MIFDSLKERRNKTKYLGSLIGNVANSKYEGEGGSDCVIKKKVFPIPQTLQ